MRNQLWKTNEKQKFFLILIITFIIISFMFFKKNTKSINHDGVLDSETLKSIDSFNKTLDSFHERTPGIRFYPSDKDSLSNDK